MLDQIKASLERHNARQSDIEAGAAIMSKIFGPHYPIGDLCGALDYGDIAFIRGANAEGAREMQYAQILRAFMNLMGAEFDNINWNDLLYIRKELFAGKLDAWIYQGR